MTYNISTKKVYLGFSSNIEVGDQVCSNDISYVVKDKIKNKLFLTKRILTSDINNLTMQAIINNNLPCIAEYSFLPVSENTNENVLINTSTFVEGTLNRDGGRVHFYCVDLKNDKITSVKRALFYCKNPHLVIQNTETLNAFILPFSETKKWVELSNEDTSVIGDVIRALKRDVFPVFDAGRWSRSSDNNIISVDWDNYCFCVSTGSGNLHNLRPFDDIPCTCEDGQHRGFTYKCKHLISLERQSHQLFGKTLIEALADKL